MVAWAPQKGCLEQDRLSWTWPVLTLPAVLNADLQQPLHGLFGVCRLCQVSLHSPLSSQVHGSAQERAEQGDNQGDIPQLGALWVSQAGFPGAKRAEANQSLEPHFCPSWRFPQKLLTGFSV